MRGEEESRGTSVRRLPGSLSHVPDSLAGSLQTRSQSDTDGFSLYLVVLLTSRESCGVRPAYFTCPLRLVGEHGLPPPSILPTLRGGCDSSDHSGHTGECQKGAGLYQSRGGAQSHFGLKIATPQHSFSPRLSVKTFLMHSAQHATFLCPWRRRISALRLGWVSQFPRTPAFALISQPGTPPEDR